MVPQILTVKSFFVGYFEYSPSLEGVLDCRDNVYRGKYVWNPYMRMGDFRGGTRLGLLASLTCPGYNNSSLKANVAQKASLIHKEIALFAKNCLKMVMSGLKCANSGLV